MSADTLDLKGAATHFLRTEGPRGFLLRFALVYAVFALVLQAISLWTQAPLYEIYVRAFTENDGDISPYLDEMNAVSMQTNLASLVMLPISLALWVLFEAASQRRYIRAEGFRLALGADEGRLAVVGLIWFALLIVGYLGLLFAALIPGLIVGLVAGAPLGFVVGGIVFLAGFVIALYLFARLSAASALTMRDNQIRFFESWQLTKGHGWRLAGSYFLLFAAFLILSLIVYGLVIFVGFALLAPAIDSSAGSETANAVLSVMGAPSFWAPISLLMFLVLMMQSVFSHALGGPAALVVRRRTVEGGMTLTDTFG
jgi:hypothetical protein